MVGGGRTAMGMAVAPIPPSMAVAPIPPSRGRKMAGRTEMGTIRVVGGRGTATIGRMMMKTKKPMIPRKNLLLSPRKVNMSGVDGSIVVVGFFGLGVLGMLIITHHIPLALFANNSSSNTEPTKDPTDEPTDKPRPKPTPAPTPEETPEPTPNPTKRPRSKTTPGKCIQHLG